MIYLYSRQCLFDIVALVQGCEKDEIPTEVHIFSASQGDSPHMSLSIVHCRIHNSRPLVSEPDQSIPPHLTYFLKIHFNIILAFAFRSSPLILE